LEIATKRPFPLVIGGRYLYKNFNGLIQAHSVWAHREEVALVVVCSPWSVDEEKRLENWEFGIEYIFSLAWRFKKSKQWQGCFNKTIFGAVLKNYLDSTNFYLMGKT
jgi:hypothetical protein